VSNYSPLSEAERARRVESAAHARAVRARAIAVRDAADPAKLAKAVRTVVAGAPTLTAEQVEQLRALLPSAGPDNVVPLEERRQYDSGV
jgi:hypothetical protein